MTDLRKAAETTQPEALRLADLLERRGYASLTMSVRIVDKEIATKLRRLHGENERLRQALAHEVLDRMVAENERLGLYVDAVNISAERVDETVKRKREWVGLTDDDVHDAFNYVEMVKLLDFDRDRPEWCEAFARACEATLRHRNGEKQ